MLLLLLLQVQHQLLLLQVQLLLLPVQLVLLQVLLVQHRPEDCAKQHSCDEPFPPKIQAFASRSASQVPAPTCDCCKATRAESRYEQQVQHRALPDSSMHVDVGGSSDNTR